MSTLQQRPHRFDFDRVPEPSQAREGDDRGNEVPESGRAAEQRYLRALRYGSVFALVVILLAGYWKPHPVSSLAVPLVATALWWPVLRTRGSERWLFFYVAGIYLYTVLRAFADDAGFVIQADYVIEMDRFLFSGDVPSVELQRDFFSPREVDFIDIAATGVHWSFFIVPHAVFAYLWLRRPALATRFAGAVLLTLYVGLVLFWMVPTVPPWLAARQGDLAPTYRIMDFVTRGVDLQAYRDLYRTLAEPNAVASVPSIHMALTFLVLLVSRDVAPRWWWALAGYNVAMAFSLVYLGEHYVFDILVGMLVASVAYVLLLRRGQPLVRDEAPLSPKAPRAA